MAAYGAGNLTRSGPEQALKRPTGRAETAERRRRQGTGATRYLTKPLDVARFLEVVDELLGARHR
jgi:CheY-like chemotaxis protein